MRRVLPASFLLLALVPQACQRDEATAPRSLPLRAQAVAGSECASPPPGTIWCDDFEVDRLSSYFERLSSNTFGRAAGVGVDGSYGMRAVYTPGVAQAGDLKLAFGRSPDPAYVTPVDAGTADYRDIYWRAYLKNSAGWTGGGGGSFTKAMVLASPAWAQAAVGQVHAPDGDALLLDPVRGTDEDGALATGGYNDVDHFTWLGNARGATPVFAAGSLGKWYCVEAHMKLNDAGQSNGVLEYWIDGTLDAQRTGLNFLGSYSGFGINALFFENYWEATAPQPEERYWDNIVVATQRIGCGHAGPPPPSGTSKIAFSSDRDGNFEIYVMSPDGSDVTRLTTNSARDFGPSWSPDGSKIAFWSDRDGNSEIYVMNADGSEQTRLTDNSASDQEPAWSPDGRRIAFVSSRDGNNEIYVMNADGSAPTRLTNNSTADNSPNWSPDGLKIAFVGSGRHEDSPFSYDIYVMNADGSGETRLTSEGTTAHLSPSWSPDGAKIAFQSHVQIYVMNADGSAQRNLTNLPGSNNSNPAWSPDGERIAFESDRDLINSKEIYVMNADGSGQTRLTSNSARDVNPAWGVAAEGSHDVGLVVFITEPPAWVGANAVMSPAVRVMAKDVGGRLVQHGVVRIALDASPAPGATLAGTTQAETMDGIATFADLRIDQPGPGYTLRAQAGPVVRASRAFAVVGPATRLAFVTEPPATAEGTVPLSPAVRVAIQDAVGTTVPNATTAVTLALGANPTAATLLGTTAVAAVEGIATFTDLRVDRPGDGYTLAATAPGLSRSTSASFSVHPLVFATVSAGVFHTCGLSTSGAAYCWGGNLNGGLGDGTTMMRTSPVLVVGGLRFAMVSTGTWYTCGVTTDGAAYCWGQNYTGQFGDGTTRATSSIPVPAAAGLRFATVSAGSDFACGVTIDGAGYCWGSNGLGELGGGTSQPGSTTPVAVTGGLSFTALAAAYAHTCGVTGTEEASCWGWNVVGQLGDGTTANRSTPGLVSGGLRFTMVSTGTYHTCAVTPSAAAYCWGGNGGRLGDGTTNQSPVPTPVAGGLSFSGVAVAERHSCGVTTDGAPYCWGWNDDGQLGDGTTLQRTTPVPVAGGLVFRAVSAGRSHTCGVTTSGAVYCWGGNADGQLGNGTTTSSLTPVQVVP